MADTTDNTPSDDPPVMFVQFHQPSLPVGRYTLTVQQQVSSRSGKVSATTFEATRDLFVAGARFVLLPADIQSVFPPAGSLGDHSATLPHIVLTDSTLPWIAKRDDGRLDVPWLVLVVFDADAAPQVEQVALTDLAQSAVLLPSLDTFGDGSDAKVSVIEVPRTLLPSLEEQALLAHVRRRTDERQGTEVAVVAANRLPQQGGASVVHLVALAGRPADGSLPGATDSLRLLSLANWSFVCAPDQLRLAERIAALNRDPATLRLPAVPAAEEYIEQGLVPLAHALRQGSATVSWYHGPLGTGPCTDAQPLPAPAADALLRYDRAIGMLDTSYAAAWQLGRLLGLQSKQFARSLYLLRRARVQEAHQKAERAAAPHLPHAPKIDTAELEKTVADWINDVCLLKGVPLPYMLPDERLLPPESIRFLWVNAGGVDCMVDGALSLGRVSAGELEQDRMTPPAANPYAEVSGALIRSDAVAGWPNLQVIARDAQGGPLHPLRIEQLSPTVLLCLFKGAIAQLIVGPRPEDLHLGVDAPDVDSSVFHKHPRDTNGLLGAAVVPIPWRDETARVVDVLLLAKALGAATSEQLAFQMIEGTKQIVFGRRAAGA